MIKACSENIVQALYIM